MSEHIDQDDLAGMLPSEIVEMVNSVLDSEAALRERERQMVEALANLWTYAEYDRDLEVYRVPRNRLIDAVQLSMKSAALGSSAGAGEATSPR